MHSDVDLVKVLATGLGWHARMEQLLNVSEFTVSLKHKPFGYVKVGKRLLDYNSISVFAIDL